MFLKMKKRIIVLFDSINEMVDALIEMNDPSVGIRDCVDALNAIKFQLEQEESIPKNTLNKLLKVESLFVEIYNNLHSLNTSQLKDLSSELNQLKSICDEEVKAKLKIVFLPYKASMWDSLETIYEAANKDDNCVAHVVPIPYYQLTQNEAVPTYEGEHFPKNIPITHYSQYNLEEEEPDIIYVHNIYDNYNTLTRVFEKYFTVNLKKYTDMLVYVPYHVSSFFPPQQSGVGYTAFNSPSVKNVDRIIVVNEHIKSAAIKEGISPEKILVLGSPKIDSMFKALNNEISYPNEWKDKIKGKKVYLIDTSCLFFANKPYRDLEKLVNFFNIPRFIENSVIIWRPHPLSMVSVIKFQPNFSEYYSNLLDTLRAGNNTLYDKVILDETDDYIPALKAADVFISAGGSLLRTYLLTEKKVLFWDEKSPEGSLLPPDVFYYAYDQKEPWYELVKKFSKGYDPLAKNRIGMAAKVYENTDGTSGEKIYRTIKEQILKGS